MRCQEVLAGDHGVFAVNLRDDGGGFGGEGEAEDAVVQGVLVEVVLGESGVVWRSGGGFGGGEPFGVRNAHRGLVVVGVPDGAAVRVEDDVVEGVVRAARGSDCAAAVTCIGVGRHPYGLCGRSVGSHTGEARSRAAVLGRATLLRPVPRGNNVQLRGKGRRTR